MAPFAAFTVLYVFLAVMVVVIILLRRQFIEQTAAHLVFATKANLSPCLN